MMFLDASLMESSQNGLSRAGVSREIRAYVVGAVEALAVRRKVDHDGLLALAVAALERIGVSHSTAKAWMTEFDKRGPETLARAAFSEGRDTMVQWLDGKDNNAPMRLAQLIEEWQGR
jgi:hypothetical protein